MTKEFLSRANVSFDSKVLDDADVKEELRLRGFITRPVTFIDGEAIIGFNPKAITKVLGFDASKVQQELRVISDAEMFRRLIIFIDALVKLTRQLPKDVFLRDYGGRQAPLMTGIRHEFQFLRIFLDSRRTGVVNVERMFADRNAMQVDWVDSEDPLAVADYGEQIKRQVEEWGKTFTEEELEQPVSGFYGDVTVSHVIAMAVGHTAYHIKTRYSMASEDAGIEPPVRLPDSLFEGLPRPKDG